MKKPITIEDVLEREIQREFKKALAAVHLESRCDLAIARGFIEVTIPNPLSESKSRGGWCGKYIKGEFIHTPEQDRWFFKDDKDAVMFLLRWS
jgi:hypothetical protein